MPKQARMTRKFDCVRFIGSLILDLTLAGEVGGLNRLFSAQMRRMTAAAAANRVHLLKMVVQNRRIFKKFPPTQPGDLARLAGTQFAFTS